MASDYFFITTFHLTIPANGYTNTTNTNSGYTNNANANSGPTLGSLWDHFTTTPDPAHYQISHAHAR